MADQGNVGAARYEITTSGTSMTVHVVRDYPAGAKPTTAARVWQIAADFGGIKKIFPSLLRVYLTYPNAKEDNLELIRDMTFSPPQADKPLAPGNQLSMGIEQLKELDPKARRLTYISVLGLPVTGYQSVMEVTGDDACQLAWTSTFTPNPGQESIAGVLAQLLGAGANQIAKELNVA